MIKKNILLIIIILFFSNKSLLADIKIVVSIDDEIITNHDIEKESNYLEILNPNLIQLSDKQKFSLAKNSLINEIVKKETNKFGDIENKNINRWLFYLKLGLTKEIELENIKTKKILFSEIKKDYDKFHGIINL